MKTEIYVGDCLNVLPQLPAQSVNLIVTSPPYAEQRKKNYGGIPEHLYVDWFLARSAEFMRVLKPDGSFILNIKENCKDGERSTYVIELVLALKQQGWKWIEEYIWDKTTSYPGHWPSRFRDAWEHCYHFTKATSFAMYQDAVMVPASPSTIKRVANLSELDKIRVESKSGTPFGKRRANWLDRDMVYPDNVLHYPPEFTNVGHPAPFPVNLPFWFIKLFTKEGDTVLDPFLGSASSAVAANRLGRDCIGCELSLEYAKLAEKRVYEDAPMFNEVKILHPEGVQSK